MKDLIGYLIALIFYLAMIIIMFIMFLAFSKWYGQTERGKREKKAAELRHLEWKAAQEAHDHQFAADVGARWQREGHTVQFGPVRARYCGDSPDHVNRLDPDWGALGLADERLWFVGQSSANFEIKMPLDAIRWVGQVNVQALRSNVMTVCREKNDEWRLDLFTLDDVGKLVQAMQETASIPFSTHMDYGPTAAVRLRQDIYGQWQRGYTLPLYLAPDRLLAGWHTAARLDCIRGLAVLPATGLNLMNAALLRLSYTDPEGRPQVIGFEMALGRARAWADVLYQRTGVTVDDALGRKKKEDESPAEIG